MQICSLTIDVLFFLKKDVFSHVPTCSFINSQLLPIMGAFHAAELPFVFGARSNVKCAVTPLEDYLSFRMIDYWTSFANGSAPSSTLDGTVGVWPISTVSAAGLVTSVVLDAPYDQIVTGYRSNFCKLWM